MSQTPVTLHSNGMGTVYQKGTWRTNATTTPTNLQVVAALKDSDDTTWISPLTAPFARMFNFDDVTLPADSRVISVAPKFRGKTNSLTAGSYWLSNIYLGTKAAPGTLVQQGNSNFYSWVDYRAFNDRTGPKLSTNRNGELIDNAQLNNIGLYINTTSAFPNAWKSTQMRISELSLEVFYDEKPVVSNVTPAVTGNSIFTDTLTPFIDWDYEDDWQAQLAYQVQILNGTTVVQDSLVTVSGDTGWQVPQSLAQGVQYTVRVRAQQNWSGPGGEFWSDWAYSAGTFTLAVVGAPAAQVENGGVDEDGYVAVNAQHNMNILSYDDASFENGFLSWGQSALTGATMAANTSSTYIFEGAGSLKITQTGATSVAEGRNLVKVIGGQRYAFSLRHKLDAASTIGTMNVAVGINWATAAGIYISSSEDGYDLVSKTNWVASEVFANAPANAAYAYFYFAINDGANGRILYIDSAEFLMMNPGDTSYSVPSRGGMILHTPNLLSRNDSTFDGGVVSWEVNDILAASVEISSTQKRQGTTSLKINRTAATSGQTLVYLNSGKLPAPDLTTPGWFNLFASFYPQSTTLFNFGVEWRNAAGTAVAWSETNVATPTLNQWTDKQAIIANPSNSAISYGVPFFYFNGVATAQFNYVDALMLAPSDTGVQVGYQPGYITSDGPYIVVQALDVPGFPYLTQAQFDALAISDPAYYATLVAMIQARYAEAAIPNSGVEWQEIYRSLVNVDYPDNTLKDRSAQSGVARMYRAYSYKYENDILISSQTLADTYDGVTCPSTIVFNEVWLSTVEQQADLVNGGLVEDGFDACHFIVPRPGQSESFTKEAATIKLAGREYPVVSFGASSDGGISVTIAFAVDLQGSDLASFKTLAARRSLVIYRNGFNNQRMKGLMENISYSYNKGVAEASFTITASGDQYQ